MKISKEQLKQIIKEELEIYQEENDLTEVETIDEIKIPKSALGAFAAIGLLASAATAKPLSDTEKRQRIEQIQKWLDEAGRAANIVKPSEEDLEIVKQTAERNAKFIQQTLQQIDAQKQKAAQTPVSTGVKRGDTTGRPRPNKPPVPNT